MQYAIVAGSGFERLGDDAHAVNVVTDYGEPSAPIRQLRYGKHAVYLLRRHGDEQQIPPHAINYRANLQALQRLGAGSVIAINTVGVITPDVEPGMLAVPDQLLDYTWGRAHSIYDGTGRLDHIDFTEPFSAELRKDLLQAARDAGVAIHDGGVYATMQGPRLETAAEVDRLERDGVDFVGMTAMPEAALARELGMNYACLSLIVNYAAGRGEKSIHADIDVSMATARTRAMQVLRTFFGAEET